MLWECVWPIIQIVPEEEGQQKKRTDWEREQRKTKHEKIEQQIFVWIFFLFLLFVLLRNCPGKNRNGAKGIRWFYFSAQKSGVKNCNVSINLYNKIECERCEIVFFIRCFSLANSVFYLLNFNCFCWNHGHAANGSSELKSVDGKELKTTAK